MGRQSELRVIDPVLTELASGYSNDQFIGEKLFPVASVTKEGGKIPIWGKEAFKEWESLRALRASSNEMEGMMPTYDPFNLDEYDLAHKLDKREISEASDILDLETNAAFLAAEGVKLKHEILCAKVAQDVNNYPSDLKTALTSDYLDTDTVEVIKFLHEEKSKLRSVIGRDPNVMVIGGVVWEKALKYHPKIASLISDNMNRMVTLQILQQLLEVEEVYIGKSVKLNETDNSMTDVWGNNIVMAYVRKPAGKNVSYHEPNHGYTLRKQGHPFVDKYPIEGDKVMAVRYTDNFAVHKVGTESALLIKDCVDPNNL
jgi:hypothetical protein